jgi:hypothetical protein
MWQMQPRSVLIEIATNIIGRPRYTNVTRTVPCRLCCVLGYMATEVPETTAHATDIGIEREEAPVIGVHTFSAIQLALISIQVTMCRWADPTVDQTTTLGLQ